MLKQCIKHYCNCLNSSLHQQTKSSPTTPDFLRLQRPSTDSSYDFLSPFSPDKELSRESENSKVYSGFYSHLFLVPKPCQTWRLVIDLSRLNTLKVEKFKMETA